MCGWTSAPLDMGGYDDHVMKALDGTPVAGVCHQRGPNAAIPTAWLAYVVVADLAAATAAAEQRGATIVLRREAFTVLTDPAGALFALYQAST